MGERGAPDFGFGERFPGVARHFLIVHHETVPTVAAIAAELLWRQDRAVWHCGGVAILDVDAPFEVGVIIRCQDQPRTGGGCRGALRGWCCAGCGCWRLGSPPRHLALLAARPCDCDGHIAVTVVFIPRQAGGTHQPRHPLAVSPGPERQMLRQAGIRSACVIRPVAAVRIGAAECFCVSLPELTEGRLAAERAGGGRTRHRLAHQLVIIDRPRPALARAIGPIGCVGLGAGGGWREIGGDHRGEHRPRLMIHAADGVGAGQRAEAIAGI